ncbi:hypothetical protein [Spirochaeta dissipatitropha]
MRNNRLQNFLNTIELTGRGRFYWRLWTPLLIGIVTGLLNGLFAEYAMEIYDVITDGSGAITTGVSDLTIKLIMRGAGITPLFAFFIWWSTDSTRSRMLANGSLTNYLLLPFSRSEKTYYLILRSTLLPFLTMCAAALLTLIVVYPAFLTTALRMMPFSAGMSMVIGVLGWSGSWSHSGVKIFGENISVRNQNGIGPLTFLFLISLPFPALTSASTLALLSILPYAISILWLNSSNSDLQIEGCIDSNRNNQRRTQYRSNTGGTPILNRILKSRAGNSRLIRWLLLNSFNVDDTGLMAVNSQSWQQYIKTRLFSISALVFAVLVWLFLSFREETLTAEILGLNIVLIVMVFSGMMLPLRQKNLPAGLPLRGLDMSVNRAISLSLNPVLLIPFISVSTTTVLLIFISLENAFGWHFFGMHDRWSALTGNSTLTAFQLFPAGIIWISLLNILCIAVALILDRLRFFRAARTFSSSFEISGFISIAPAIIILENHHILIEANKPLLLLGATVSLVLYLAVSHIGDRKLQRVFQ